QVFLEKIGRTLADLDGRFDERLRQYRVKVGASGAKNPRRLAQNAGNRSHAVGQGSKIALEVNVYIDRARIGHRIPRERFQDLEPKSFLPHCRTEKFVV